MPILKRAYQLKILPMRKYFKLADGVLDKKRLLLTMDDIDRGRPITISVILPTFLSTIEELEDYRYEVVRNELVALGQLLSKGLIDEVVIVDGGRDENGEADDRLVKQMIASAYRSIPLFHDQADLLNKYPALRDKAKLGLYDFGIRVIHQSDPQVTHAVKKFRILSEDFPPGKGAGLWLATGASFGDILAFFDSDIRSFQGWHVASIIEPIINTFKEDEKRIEFVKAYYTRLSMNLDCPERGFYMLGGRVKRLFMIPILKCLARHGILNGLEKLKYPLSGEFAGSRSLIESLNFPKDYGIETGMLVEIWKKGWVDKIAEADLHIFQHFPRSDDLIEDMVSQIVNLLLFELEGDIELNKEFADEYLEEAYREIELSEAIVDQSKIAISRDVKRTLYKDAEGDKLRVKAYSEILREIISHKKESPIKIFKMPPWKEVIKTLDGKNFQSFIRRRSAIYTLEILNKLEIVSAD